MKYIIMFLMLSGCVKSKSHQTESVPADFERKFKFYTSNSTIYPETDCDWLLFQSLTDSARSKKGGVERAEQEDLPGRWFRTPAHDCRVARRSDTDISRDMLLGLAVYLWQTDQRNQVQEIVDFADKFNGVMGGGTKSRTLILPALYNTYKSILARTGSLPLPPKVDDPDINAGGEGLTDVTTPTGYEAHLLVLHILLRGLVYGELSSLEVSLLQDQVERQPRNAFYQAVYHKFSDGNQTEAIALLMDETLFPGNGLPTNVNYCTDWIWQRDIGHDWEPCQEVKIHTGGDWLFAAAIVRNGLRESQP